ncbi:MAG: hypothetical protein ACM3UU_02465 [Ignavibacteriales bacterium]
MKKTFTVLPSSVLEEILVANYSRGELIQSLRIYSKYLHRLRKNFDKHNHFARKAELARFQEYLSISASLLDKWYNDISRAHDQIISFVSQRYALPLTDEFLNLHDDFPALCKRFEKITYACLDILGEDNKDIELYVIPMDYDFDIFIPPISGKAEQAPANSIWLETGFSLLRTEKLEKELFEIIDLLKDLELELLLNSSRSYEHSRLSFNALTAQAERTFLKLLEVHNELDKRLVPFFNSESPEADKTYAKFQKHYEEIFLKQYWAMKLNAAVNSCEYLMECNKISSTRRASDF